MTKTIVVEKVPLGYRPVDNPPAFPPLPVLYLEFLENKEKVRADLRDKASAPIFFPEEKIKPIDSNLEFYKAEEPVPSVKSPESNIRSKLNDRMKKTHSDAKPKEEIIRDHQSIRERKQEEDRDREKSKEYTNKKDPPRSLSPKKPREVSENKQTREIQDMLGGSERLPPKIQQAPSAPSLPLPPTLEQLGGETVHIGGRAVKDISYTNEEEHSKKRELLFRFDILRKSYKEATIPEISEFTDLRTMERVYEDTVRRVALDGKVEGYKKFLQMGFFGLEFVFSNLFKIDMSGFAKQQLMSMNSYERLLIELGEKSLLEKTKSQWPAEVRLLFTIVMNGVMFVLMKSVMSGGLNNLFGGGGGGGMMGGLGNLMGALGGMGGGGGLSDMMGALGGMGGATAPSAANAPKQAPVDDKAKATSRKMRGPQINLDEIGKKTN